MNKILISKIFTDTEIPDNVLKLPNVEYGGTGFYYDKAPKLPDEIEHCMPDYHLYDDFIASQIERGRKQSEFKYYTDFSIGFTTRGCIRQCEFCVNKNYKTSCRHSNISEFLDTDRKYICLLDDNVFACKDWKLIFDELISTGKRFQFKQGLDERLLTDEKCEYLFDKSKYVGDFIFAFDNIKDKNLIESKLKLIRKYSNKICRFYCFCGFNHDNPESYDVDFWQKDIKDLLERIRIIMQYGCIPYVMRFKDYKLSPYKDLYIQLARWCNQPNVFKKMSFREFCEADQKLKKTNKIGAAIRALNIFENDCPDIAEKYFDMRYEGR